MGVRGPKKTPRLVLAETRGDEANAFGPKKSGYQHVTKPREDGHLPPLSSPPMRGLSAPEKDWYQRLVVRRHRNCNEPLLNPALLRQEDSITLCLLAKQLAQVEAGEGDRMVIKDAVALLGKFGSTPGDRERMTAEVMAEAARSAAKRPSESDFGEFE